MMGPLVGLICWLALAVGIFFVLLAIDFIIILVAEHVERRRQQQVLILEFELDLKRLKSGTLTASIELDQQLRVARRLLDRAANLSQIPAKNSRR